MPDPDIPRAAKTLLSKLEGWSVHQYSSSGTVEFGGLSEDTDGEGKRHRVSVLEQVDSFLVRARHVDGRALVAVWLRRPGETPTGRRKGWTLDTCWRGRHASDLTPKQMTHTEMARYVEAPDAPGALLALEQLAQEQEAKKAAKVVAALEADEDEQKEAA